MNTSTKDNNIVYKHELPACHTLYKNHQVPSQQLQKAQQTNGLSSYIISISLTLFLPFPVCASANNEL